MLNSAGWSIAVYQDSDGINGETNHLASEWTFYGSSNVAFRVIQSVLSWHHPREHHKATEVSLDEG